MAERDASGRFVAGNGAANGNKGGPGRPKKKREEKYQEITMTACTFADWKRIVDKAVAQAIRGNPQARQWLAGYLVGPPKQKVEHSGGVHISYSGNINPDDV